MASVLIEVLVNHPQCRFQISAQVMQADPSRWHRFNSSVYSLLVRGEVGNLFTYEIICEAEQELFYVLHSFVDMKDRLILLSCVKWSRIGHKSAIKKQTSFGGLCICIGLIATNKLPRSHVSKQCIDVLIIHKYSYIVQNFWILVKRKSFWFPGYKPLGKHR